MSRGILSARVRGCFAGDDDSLPTVDIQNLTPAEVADLYSLIRRESRLVTARASFWDDKVGADRLLDDVPNAALLVGTGGAAPFHFTVEGTTMHGVQLPVLGIHVFQDTIAVDYKMGEQWGDEEIIAFFGWLQRLLSRTGAGVLEPNANEGPSDPAAFMVAWKSFGKPERDDPKN